MAQHRWRMERMGDLLHHPAHGLAPREIHLANDPHLSPKKSMHEISAQAELSTMEDFPPGIGALRTI